MSQGPEEILQLIRSGRKIDAIKRLRETSGLGLREATDAVEQMGGSASSPMASSTSQRSPTAVDFEVRQLAQSGQRLAAIKLLRERNRIGLKQAKDLLDATVPPPPGSASLPWLAAAVLAAVAAAFYLLR